MLSRLKDGTFAPWIVVVLGLTVIATVGFVYAYSKGYQTADQRHQAEYTASHSAQQHYQECISHPTAQEALECYQSAEAASREDQRAEQDLNAQREMADWAEGMLWVTLFVGVLTISVTGLGVYWVKETLVATREAVRAADDAVIVTREIGEAQVRAYLQIVDGSLVLRPGENGMVDRSVRPVVTIGVKNHGQSPARWFRWSVIARYYPPMDAEFRGSLGFAPGSWGRDIGVGEMETFTTNLGSAPLTDEDMQCLATQEFHIDLVVRYIFEDVFENLIEDERVFTTYVPANGTGMTVKLLPHPLSRSDIEGLVNASRAFANVKQQPAG